MMSVTSLVYQAHCCFYCGFNQAKTMTGIVGNTQAPLTASQAFLCPVQMRGQYIGLTPSDFDSDHLKSEFEDGAMQTLERNF